MSCWKAGVEWRLVWRTKKILATTVCFHFFFVFFIFPSFEGLVFKFIAPGRCTETHLQRSHQST